jgi:hypothetical protein
MLYSIEANSGRIRLRQVLVIPANAKDGSRL